MGLLIPPFVKVNFNATTGVDKASVVMVARNHKGELTFAWTTKVASMNLKFVICEGDTLNVIGFYSLVYKKYHF